MRTVEEQQKMKDLAIEKWEYMVKHPTAGLSQVREDIPKLEHLRAACSYCEKYFFHYCEGCPVKMNNLRCSDIGHPYYKWRLEQTTKAAKAVLELIKQIEI